MRRPSPRPTLLALLALPVIAVREPGAQQPAPGAAPAAPDSARRADSAQVAAATAGPPGTDVWIATLSGRGAALAVGAPENATARPGYDNQPSFSPDGRWVLFTSIRDDGQADIYRYDTRARATERLTTTPESEYSPTVMPDGRSISVVRVERDSTQRLWRMDAAGRDFRPVLERVKPVGYHAWADARTLALFVLGDPPTLQLADAPSGDARVVTDSIGRALHRIPGQRAVSFVRKRANGEWWIERLDLPSARVRPLVRTLPGVEDYAWTPSGVVLAARESTLYAWSPARADAGWTAVATFQGMGRVTRLAVSPDGRRLALVAQEPAPTR